MSNSIFDILGIIGTLLLGLKILLHIYIKSLYTQNYSSGAGGNFLKAELFFPVFDDVEKKYILLKKLTNIIYLVSLLLIVVFVLSKVISKD
jgi:hypothetical protein